MLAACVRLTPHAWGYLLPTSSACGNDTVWWAEPRRTMRERHLGMMVGGGIGVIVSI